MNGIKERIRRALLRAGWVVHRAPRIRVRGRTLRDEDLYRPLFSPWFGAEFGALYERIRSRTLVAAQPACVLWTLARQAAALEGEFWECGVYRGGTAMLLAEVLASRPARSTLRLFDTFEGMPDADPDRDLHRRGDFADTSLESVRSAIGDRSFVSFHPGLMPGTFAGLESSRIAFAHVDVDLHRSVLDACEFIYPRLVPGGFLVFDDYGFPSCPGARDAVDEFFAGRPERPLVLSTAQAVVFRTPMGAAVRT